MAKKSNKIVNYFKDVKSELKKVVWPSFKQVKNNTLIVLVCLLVMGIFISVFDFVFEKSLGTVVEKLQGDTQTQEVVDTQGEKNTESTGTSAE